MSATCPVSAPAPSPSSVLAARPRSLTFSGAVALGVRLTGAGGLFLSYIVLARTLGAKGFGEYALAITWLQALVVPAKLGLDNTSLRFVSEYATRGQTGRLKQFVRESGQACFLASSILVCGLILFTTTCWNLLEVGLARSLIVAALMIPLLAGRQIREAGLRAVGRLMESQISTAIWPLLLCLLALIVESMKLIELTPPLATSLHLISFAVVYQLVTGFQRRVPMLRNDCVDDFSGSSPDTNTTASDRERAVWFSVATAFLLAESLIAVKSRACVALAGILLNGESVGLYAAMERIADVSVLGSQSLGLVIAPQFATLFSARRFPEMRRLMRYGQILILACTLPVALGVAIFSDVVFRLLGESYRGGDNLLLMLLASVCIASLSGPGAYVLQMTGRERTMLHVTAIAAGTNLVLALLLIPFWGILGLGIAQIGTSLTWTTGVWWGLRNHPIWSDSKSAEIGGPL